MNQLRKRVALEGIRFFAYHGYYPEEQILGNEFIVDIETEMDSLHDDNDELSDTVNYERLFDIASAEMQETRKLIEKVAYSILNRIQDEFPAVDVIKVSIRKLRLPLKGEPGNSLVELSFKR